MKQLDLHIVISGGGTGGHLFPALAIAEALKKLEPSVKILFVGALGKIEMEKVPAAGYVIEGLDIMGLQRSLTLQNLRFPIRLIKSLFRSRAIIKQFKPDAAVGVGGYASGPLLFMAELKRIPCLIQEQNSYPGITNKILASRAVKICVAYPGMERFFPDEKLMLTGNPVRKSIVDLQISHVQALKNWGLDPDMPVLLVLGGSLGARTLNESIFSGLDKLKDEGIQLIWQAGKRYNVDLRARVGIPVAGVQLTEFINNMDEAYAAADIIISRAGAGTISELAWAARPVILVPSPNVAEDHQTRNAQALVSGKAAMMVSDADAPKKLVETAIELIRDKNLQHELKKNIQDYAYPDAAAKIAAEIIRLASIYRNKQ